MGFSCDSALAFPTPGNIENDIDFQFHGSMLSLLAAFNSKQRETPNDRLSLQRRLRPNPPAIDPQRCHHSQRSARGLRCRRLLRFLHPHPSPPVAEGSQPRSPGEARSRALADCRVRLTETVTRHPLFSRTRPLAWFFSLPSSRAATEPAFVGRRHLRAGRHPFSISIRSTPAGARLC